ncbi:uncharacterized protein LOC120747992 isoform X2 [Hirundo rustica]|uniref:uncharacterized protein LOC120747992 isoform X2 n=1 Tax=Hirundo rustica TaxID=43150 RepID=UPI001A950819|nr:uncharacterized protein LOC120747992 isoform X2 [Hirundo rustica]
MSAFPGAGVGFFPRKFLSPSHTPGFPGCVSRECRRFPGVGGIFPMEVSLPVPPPGVSRMRFPGMSAFPRGGLDFSHGSFYPCPTPQGCVSCEYRRFPGGVGFFPWKFLSPSTPRIFLGAFPGNVGVSRGGCVDFSHGSFYPGPTPRGFPGAFPGNIGVSWGGGVWDFSHGSFYPGPTPQGCISRECRCFLGRELNFSHGSFYPRPTPRGFPGAFPGNISVSWEWGLDFSHGSFYPSPTPRGCIQRECWRFPGGVGFFPWMFLSPSHTSGVRFPGMSAFPRGGLDFSHGSFYPGPTPWGCVSRECRRFPGWVCGFFPRKFLSRSHTPGVRFLGIPAFPGWGWIFPTEVSLPVPHPGAVFPGNVGVSQGWVGFFPRKFLSPSHTPGFRFPGMSAFPGVGVWIFPMEVSISIPHPGGAFPGNIGVFRGGGGIFLMEVSILVPHPGVSRVRFPGMSAFPGGGCVDFSHGSFYPRPTPRGCVSREYRRFPEVCVWDFSHGSSYLHPTPRGCVSREYRCFLGWWWDFSHGSFYPGLTPRGCVSCEYRRFPEVCVWIFPMEVSISIPHPGGAFPGNVGVSRRCVWIFPMEVSIPVPHPGGAFPGNIGVFRGGGWDFSHGSFHPGPTPRGCVSREYRCFPGTSRSAALSAVRGRCSSAPRGSACFQAQGSPGLRLRVLQQARSVKLPSSVARWPLRPAPELLLAMDAPSKEPGDEKVRISYFREAGGVPVGRAVLYLTCVEVSLDADVSRSGAVSRTLLDKASWTWGPDGHGAVLLVNCDRDDPGTQGLDSEDSAVRSYNDLKDMSQLVLRTRGPRAIFAAHRLLLHVDFGHADKIRVFYGGSGAELEQFRAVLGGSRLSYSVRLGRHCHESVFYVEGLAFPDVSFSGLVSLHVTLLESHQQGLLESPIFTDSVVFRVAPWIMTPNTAAPLEVFVCSVDDNEGFVAAVGALAERARCPLTVCPAPQNRQDRWIQDEMEFGYVQAPHKTFPVVFDSPRDRGLKDFPVRSILGPDFGYVARHAPEGASSLDSFGNLEVSPPVTVQGKEYPLGRILVGSSFPRLGGRRMAKAVRQFLEAQEVQAPVELFSDWLHVGHVDEFLSFVPAPDRKGFRLLLASPSACYQLLREKQEEGFGEAAMFQELDRDGVPKPTINEILANEELRKFNDYAQSCISWNRDILKRSLGLAEPDILDIPQLFRGDAASGAEAFFPDMVNMLVLGRHLGIPKPFGPVVGGRCCLEQRVRELLEPLGLSCTFIDDFFSYHVLSGDVHCGTNVRRKPFAFKWWHVVP